MLLAYAGQGIGLVVACGFTSRIMALIATPLAIAPFILFTPYAVNVERIPPYMRIVQVGSPFWVSAHRTRTRGLCIVCFVLSADCCSCLCVLCCVSGASRV